MVLAIPRIPVGDEDLNYLVNRLWLQARSESDRFNRALIKKRGDGAETVTPAMTVSGRAAARLEEFMRRYNAKD
jgi:hypothetical protein